MNNNELISVIVPIYNVDKYLKKCIESIINQTYKNLEIILINDGSNDSCESICNYYKNKDKRIILITQENSGLSSARNKGLDNANGSYLCFVDADDYIESDMIEELKKNMDKFQSDISSCNYYIVDKLLERKVARLYEKDEYLSSGKSKFNNIENDLDVLTYYAWNKLYKKSLFDNIRFPVGRVYEFTYIMCDLFDEAYSISYTTKPLYNYVYRSNSISHIFSTKHFNKIDSYNRKINFFKQKGYFDLLIIEKNKKCETLISYLCEMKINKIIENQIFNNYYFELINSSKEIEWKYANKHIRLFKLLGCNYIRFRVFKMMVWKKLK